MAFAVTGQSGGQRLNRRSKGHLIGHSQTFWTVAVFGPSEEVVIRPERTTSESGSFRFNEQRGKCVSSACLGRSAPERGRSTRVCDRILFVQVVHLRPRTTNS